ncbi:MAG: gamma-glutamyltransferase family protein [Pseudomonadota bacterium]
MRFTTRPEIKGRFGVCASTHWIATGVGMSVLERGGNAADAAVAMGVVLTIVEPHLCGVGGDLPLLLWRAEDEAPKVLCAQGPAPAGATIARMTDEGLTRIPGSGLLATVIPGAMEGWLMLAQEHGTWELADLLAPAIAYARDGHPILPGAAAVIAGLETFFTAEWPTSAAVWLPGGKAPQPWQEIRNPKLAENLERIVAEGAGARTREARIQGSRDAVMRGFVAEALGAFATQTEAMDATGARRRGVLTAEDMAGWQASWEAPLSRAHREWEVFKTGPWGQGPVLLQALGIAEAAGIEAHDPGSAEHVHLVLEAMKLACADREAYYGDSAPVPMDALLDPAHAASRAALIGEAASLEQRPSRLPGHQAWADAAIARAVEEIEAAGAGSGEPTMADMARATLPASTLPKPAPTQSGDTVHIDVIDRDGLMISATPSGGWLQSSPIVPALGFALNTRAQMFWLEEGLASSLKPGARPRTTLSPSMARGPDGTRYAFGTPGGDQQDQWQLALLLRLMAGEADLQAAIDAPLFHTTHFQGSFWPRAAEPGRVLAEGRLGEEVLDALRARRHRLDVPGDWSLGRLTAAARAPDGRLRAGATPLLMQAYAAGR